MFLFSDDFDSPPSPHFFRVAFDRDNDDGVDRDNDDDDDVNRDNIVIRIMPIVTKTISIAVMTQGLPANPTDLRAKPVKEDEKWERFDVIKCEQSNFQLAPHNHHY